MVDDINESRAADCSKKPEPAFLSKGPRRRTIFLPNDTTFLTIHPDSKQSKLIQGDDILHEPTSGSALRKPGGVSSRRFALKDSQTFPQSLINMDRPGLPTGKENIPPSQRCRKFHVKSSSTAKSKFSKSPPSDPSKLTNLESHERRQVLNPLLTRCKETSTAWQHHRLEQSPISSCSVSRLHSEDLVRSNTRTLYPPICEDILAIQMFDDTWLKNQEVTIAELSNRILQNSTISKKSNASDSIRRQMMAAYQHPSMILIHKRLQASLQFGALALPREHNGDNIASRFMVDVALRERFVKLWIESYQIDALTLALEVVVGRHVLTLDHDSEELAIQKFIEACLLYNHDAPPTQEMDIVSQASRSWRRTMLRALLVILLLDKARESEILSGNLFKKTSRLKSSTMILAELNDILRSSRADMSRQLVRLDYRLDHVQLPLSEFNYNVKNLAVDFRNGVRLARIVELLLPATNCEDIQDSLIRSPRGSSRPNLPGMSTKLSQHLKYPLLSRASKIGNVQISLEALSQKSNIAGIIKEITAVDIVDGHREKTVALLWSLISQFGMGNLIDWEDLYHEIVRLQSEVADKEVMEPPSLPPDLSDLTNQRGLLKLWASLIAKKHGRIIKNFSTDFADGKVFGLVMNEYLDFLRFGVSQRRPLKLEDKLSQLGCSPTFGKLISLHCLDQILLVRSFNFQSYRNTGSIFQCRVCSNAVSIVLFALTPGN